MPLSHKEMAAQLANEGPQALTDIELLALSLGLPYGQAQQSLRRGYSVHWLLDEPQHIDTHFPTLARERIAPFLATVELTQRSRAVPVYTTPPITTPDEAFPHFQQIAYESQERLMVLALNPKNQVIDKKVLSIGTASQCFVSPQEICRYALQQKAQHIIIGHNHPSGNVAPSEADRKATRQIIKATQMLNIALIDHLIVGPNRHLSLRETHATLWP